MTTKISVSVKEFWPPSIEEGWGDTKLTGELSGAAHFGTINNCGIALLQNISGGVLFMDVLKSSIIPNSVRDKYIDKEWGTWKSRGILDASQQYFSDLNRKYQKEIYEEVLSYIYRSPRYNCYLMTAPVNLHSKYRNGDRAYYDIYHPSTAWFARQLIERKNGYVVQSPVSVNHMHASPTDFSLVRAWLWYPEGSLAFKPDKYLGTGTIAKKEEVVEKVNDMGNFKYKKMSKSLVEEYIDGYKIT